MFGSAPAKNPSQVAKEASSAITKDKRAVDREAASLKREEQKLCAEIKAVAKRPGGEQAAKTLAKQLIKIREQQNRLTAASGQIQSVATHVRTAGATATAASSLAGATRAMGAVNAQMSPAAINQTMQEFAKQSEMMNVKQEMVDDVFESLDESWADEDEDVLAQVMDELALDVTSQMGSAPQRKVAAGAASSADATPTAMPSVPTASPL